jgi:hypothetical protein
MLISHVEGHDPLLAHLALAACLSLDDFSQPDRLLRWGSRTELSDLDRLKSVLALAQLNDKRALPALVELLAVQDRAVATRANMALRNLTGHRVVLVPTDPDAVADVRRQWSEWLARSPASFEMRLEDLQLRGRRSNLSGNTLLALGYKNRVIELNPKGEEVWSFEALGVWSAEKTETGDVLLACYQENKVKLVSPQKAVLWEYEIPGVLKAHALDNGNVLAAAHSANKVVEISPEKKVVWEFTAETQCHDAARMDNGNTLICTANELLEVDAAGTVAWRFPAEQAYGIDLLPDGNVLVAKLGGEVIEVDRSANAIIWTYQFGSPVDVYRTDEGTTLITGAQTVVELDADKNVIWTKDICNFGSARK